MGGVHVLTIRIARQFKISRVRARTLLRSALFFFVFVAGVTVVKSATNALFLARRDPRDLPYLYLFTALVVTLATWGVGRALTHYPAKPVLRGAIVVASGLLLVFTLLAMWDVRAILGVLYVSGEAYATAISVLFWARLGEVFNVRTAKRVFGFVGAFGMAGAVLGGTLVGAFASLIPSPVWCGVAALSLLGVRRLLGPGRKTSQIRPKKFSLRRGVRYAVEEPYPRGIAGLVLLLAVQTAAVDFAFRTQAVVSEGGNETALAGLFGGLNAIVGIGAILFQGFITGPLLRRLGVFAFLSVVPLLSIGSTVWAFAVPGWFLPLF